MNCTCHLNKSFCGKEDLTQPPRNKNVYVLPEQKPRVVWYIRAVMDCFFRELWSPLIEPTVVFSPSSEGISENSRNFTTIMAEEKEKWLFKWFSPQELTHYNDIEYEVPHIIIRTIHVAHSNFSNSRKS